MRRENQENNEYPFTETEANTHPQNQENIEYPFKEIQAKRYRYTQHVYPKKGEKIKKTMNTHLHIIAKTHTIQNVTLKFLKWRYKITKKKRKTTTKTYR